MQPDPAMATPDEATTDLPAAREHTPGEDGALEDRYRNQPCERPDTPTDEAG